MLVRALARRGGASRPGLGTGRSNFVRVVRAACVSPNDAVRTLPLVLHVAATVACGGRLTPPSPQVAKDCDRFVSNARSAIDELARVNRASIADETDLFRRDCYRDDGVRDTQLYGCVLGSTDADDARPCFVTPDYFVSRRDQPVEGAVGDPTRIVWRALERLEVYYWRHGSYLVGSTGPTPAGPCCDAGAAGCAADVEAWRRDPIWRSLGVVLGSPASYQVRYHSDGVTARVAATPAAGCTPTMSYELHMSVRDGKPDFEIIERT